MSKSIGNTIALGEDDDRSAKNSRPPRLIPHGCDGKIRATQTFVIFTRCIHSSRTKSAFNGYGQVRTTAAIGCFDCKKALADNLIAHLQPIRERRAWLQANPKEVEEILRQGARKARAVAQQTMSEVRQRVGLWS